MSEEESEMLENKMIEKQPIKNEYIDKLTLELLLNKNHYGKYLAKTDPQRFEEHKLFKSKLRKYAVDIVDITSQYVENPKLGLSTEIEESFECYIKSIFRYFEMKDLENTNDYNQSSNQDTDIMFDNCNTETERETEPSTTSEKSFWGKDRVIKSNDSVKIANYDMNMFQKRR